MRVEITAPEAELIAARLKRAAETRVRRKAVNRAGSEARRDLPAILAEIYGTTRPGIGPRGKAASPGAEDPAYVLRINRKVKVAKLRATNRRFVRRRRNPLGLLTIKQPQATGAVGSDLFAAIKGEGRGQFILPARGGRRRRAVGGVPISLRKNPVVAARVHRIGADLAQALMQEMEAALSKRGR